VELPFFRAKIRHCLYDTAPANRVE
jgi:hypothetical protein